MPTNMTDQFQVEHIEYVSDQPMPDVRLGALVERLTGA
jgi:hypothetical protein